MTRSITRWSALAVFSVVVAPFACDGGGSSGSHPSPEAGAGADTGPGKDSSIVMSDVSTPTMDSQPVYDGAAKCIPDESAPVPADRCTTTPSDGSALPACGKWLKVEIPGTQCSDGSQYKFFVNYSNTSNNLVVSFEPGGACWDYESCSGAGGIRGAANPNGIPDDHMDTYQYLNLLRRDQTNPVQDWNMVFVSYCTGDVHSGDKVATYSSADGGNSITYRHLGHPNSLKVIDWINQTFKTVPKMLATGCSAGGAGSLLNYFFLRDGVAGAQCGYLLDDSGPIFHSNGPSKQLHETIRAAWNVDPIIDSVESTLGFDAGDIKQDFGLINVALAEKFPNDRLALTAYRMDFNYSLYSYQRFFPNSTEADIHAMWWEDMTALLKTYDQFPNWGYYIPYFRMDNCSHCVSIPPIDHPTATILTQPWLGSEIPQDDIDLEGFTEALIDDRKPLKSYVQDVQPTESFTPAESAACMQGGTPTTGDQ